MKTNLLILNCMFFSVCWAMDKEKSPSSDSVQPAKPKLVRFSSDLTDQKAAFEEEHKKQLNELLKTYKPGQRNKQQ